MDFTTLPKIELHLHLDCNLSLAAARTFRPTLSEDTYRREFVAPAKCLDLDDYFSRTRNTVALMQAADALRVVVDDTFDQLARDHVVYAELRFAPLLHTRGGLTGEQVVATVRAAVDAAVARSGIEARIILMTLRHFTPGESLASARLATRFFGGRVAAFDMGGNEALYPLTPHLPAFALVREHGMPITVHAGESRGAESVHETLSSLGPRRLGHGVRSIEDPHLVAQLVDEGVHLEVCPTVNVQMDVVPTYADHPVHRLFEAGVPLSVNTDTRATSDIDLRREYTRMHTVFGWTEAQFRACNVAAARAAFVDEATRARLLALVQG